MSETTAQVVDILNGFLHDYRGYDTHLIEKAIDLLAPKDFITKIEEAGRKINFPPDNSYEQFKLFKEEKISFNHIDNPSEEVCWYALKIWGGYIGYIKDPTKEMIIYALKSDYSCINYIQNVDGLSEQDWLDIIKTLPDYCGNELYARIKNKTEAINLAIIKQCPKLIEYILDQTEEVKWAAIESKQLNDLNGIKHPTIDMQKAFIRSKNYSIKSIAKCKAFIEDIKDEMTIKDIIE